MSFDYAQARLTAAKIIAKFGADGQFIKKGNGGGYDDFGDVLPPEPDVIIDGKVSPLLGYKQHEIDGERILATDSFVFFHSEIEPEIDYQITINGDTYIAKSIKSLESVNGIKVYTKIQLRK